MKKIKLTQGQFALVDDWWFDYLSKWKWKADWDESVQNYYAVRNERQNGKWKVIRMHRVVAQTPDDMICDHIHHKTLDNREAQLRNVTQSQSAINRKTRNDNKLGIKGVHKRSNGSYEANLRIKGVRLLGKTFKTLLEAAKARSEAEDKYFGEFKNK